MDALQQAVIDEARRWLGTPYMHQASMIGQGTDCIGLIRGVWRALLGPEPQTLPAYSPDWGEVSTREEMLTAAQKWLEPLSIDDATGGDVVLFRWKHAAPIKHAGILTGADHFIHAYEKAGVVESTLGSQWRSRVAAAFRFPPFKDQPEP